jgi:hypothetical protein
MSIIANKEKELNKITLKNMVIVRKFKIKQLEQKILKVSLVKLWIFLKLYALMMN